MTEATRETIGRVLAGEVESALLNSFFVLYKTARIIEANNVAFQNQMDAFYKLFRAVGEASGVVVIKIVADRYFVNEKMVRFNDEGVSGAAGVVAEWKLLGVGGVRFEAAAGKEEISKFFRYVPSIKPNEENLESLSTALKEHGLSSLTLLSAAEVDTDLPSIDEETRRRFRSMARKSFFQAVSTVQEVVLNTMQDREVNISKTKRVVHSLIDQITRDESSLLELASIKDFDDYTYAHSTNVAVYALTLGARLGLDRARLSQLGFTALFHDIGKIKLPKDLITKPDAFDEDDWIQMQRHPVLGAKTILRNMKLDLHTARAARVAFEHHINNDFTGYPVLHYRKRETGLFSRIISVVDSFDALTSGRVYLKKGMSPDVVFKKLRYQMKEKFDPFLLKLFNDIIGIYPAGSLVLLSTDEIALVLTNDDRDRSRPYVKVVGDRNGLLESPLWINLSQEDQSERKIVRQLDPERYGLDVKDFILTD
ncbi:MAG: HD domain-containing protein [Candidatus Zixiibacteriota bacterium]|nr:MAG: HD domain-containing protein [candidate division Zixibacteria bacterium]